MIIIRLNGGLGNQMFQYAFGRALSIKFKEKLFIDTFDFFSNSLLKRGTPRRFELSIFKIEGVVKGIIESFVIRFLTKIKILKKIDETNAFSFDQLAVNKKYDFYSGYWQTEKYFKSIEPTIRKEFSFKKLDLLDSQNKIVQAKIKASNSVSVHIRRGDYLTCGAHNLAKDSTCIYYKKAISFIKKQINKPSFFVFSDDLEWVKDNMGKLFGDDVIYVDFNLGKKSFLDMYLMSLCKHNIIANSSFSWWGAWLNINKKKIVVAPKVWWVGGKDGKDLIPKEWVVI